MRLTRSHDRADVERGPFLARINAMALRPLETDPEVYGATLGAMFFRDPEAATALAEARAACAGAPLRVRLHLPPELQSLRWETLRDPASQRPLALEGGLLLSRYLSGDGYQPVPLLAQASAQTLVVIAAPDDGWLYRLAPVDRADELRRAAKILKDVGSLTLLGGEGNHATWEAFATELQRGCDILYVVAHGALREGRPILYLENTAGATAPLDALALIDLARALGERRPRLIVLASCESAGDSYADAVAALGPGLAAAGVPAVLAMQGRISISTSARFQQIFFEELTRDGFVDRAASMARLAVQANIDWWIPVLYTRLVDGRIYGASRAGEELADAAAAPIVMEPTTVHNSPMVVGNQAGGDINTAGGDIIIGSPRRPRAR